MDKLYWLRRQQAAVAMAHAALSSEARLVHYDLAGRYGLRAAHGAAFMLVRKGAGSPSESREIQSPSPQAGAEPKSPRQCLPREPGS